MLTISAGASGITPIEPGTYPAICYGLIDLGEQYSEQYDKWSRKVLLMWEIPSEKIDLGGDKPVSRTITQKYTASLNERAALRRDLSAWRGRDFTEAELRAFDLRSIVGAPCLLNIIHREYNGNTYANISAIMKLPKGMSIEEPTLENIVFDLDTDPLEMIEDLPEWIGVQIANSRQYKERMTPQAAPPDINDLDLGEEEDEVPF